MCGENNQRNGYRERTLQTCAGEMHLKIPKFRHATFFPEDLLTRYSRVDKALSAVIQEMMVNGVSTRKVRRIAEDMGVNSLSSSQVSRVCHALDETVEELQQRDLSQISFPYIWHTTLSCKGK